MLYIDASAALKLIFKEKESTALKKLRGESLLSSEILALEMRRRVLVREPKKITFVQTFIENVSLLKIDSALLEEASKILPRMDLRALDSVHIASCLRSSRVIDGVLTYDRQMALALQEIGLRVISPGVDLGVI